MGMAASQVRFLQLTGRKNTIGRQLESLSLQKMSLTRDMRRVTQNYQEALNSKMLQWSNNGGVSYVDLSYANLMRPNVSNQNTPYMITNNDGKIVLDDKYQKYAEMVSPDGKSGGDWNSNRLNILSSLTNIPAERIENATTTGAAVNTAAEKVNALQETGEKLESTKNKTLVKKETAKEFWKHAGNVSFNTTSLNISDLSTNTSKWISIGNSASAKGNLTSIFNGIKNSFSSNWLSADEYKAFESACDTQYQSVAKYIGATDEASKQGLEAGTAGIKGDTGKYEINLATILGGILGGYENALSEAGLNSCGENSMGTMEYYTTDYKSNDYKNWKTQYDSWKAEYDAANANYDSAVNNDNLALNADEESCIKFYEQLFTAIAEKGWVTDSNVEDNDYLNNMLQNNQYYITTMEYQTDAEGQGYYEYNQDIASNFGQIYSVNNTNALNEATVQYEYEKSIISEKESRIDTRMQNLQTEQSAINEMLKGIESVEKNNIERTFGIFA